MTTTTVYDGTAAGQPYVSVTQTDRDAQMVVTAMLSRLTGKWHLSGRLTYPNGDHRDLTSTASFGATATTPNVRHC